MVLLMNFIFTILLFGIALIIFFAIALIRASKKSGKKSNDLEAQLREAISAARRVKFKADSDIRKIKMWANQAISEVFTDVDDIPVDELMDKYQQIRQRYADKIDKEILQKLDNLIGGYKAQIELKLQERQAAEKVEYKYTALIKDLRQAKEKQRLESKLNKQARRLASMQEDISSQKEIISRTYAYDTIEADVKQKITAMEQLAMLQQKYSSPELIQDTSVYGQELNNITAQLDE